MRAEQSKKSDTDKKPSRGKYIIAFIIFVLCILTGYVYKIVTWEPKPDPASEKVIREYAAMIIHKDPNNLTDEDFSKVEALGFPVSAGSPISILNRNRNLELSDIRLIEKFTNLNYLQLSNIKYNETKIPRLIKILGKIGINNFGERPFIDLTPLEKLIHLQTLLINKTPVNNIEPLSNLYNLKNLIIRNTYISDLEPLRGLLKLESLNLENTYISDLEPLTGLKNLKMLYIGGCKNISDKQVENLQKALPELKIRIFTTNR